MRCPVRTKRFGDLLFAVRPCRAKAAIIGCPKEELRNVLKEAVLAAEELPHSPLGGAWALDAPINRESYLFAGNITEQTVDSWINLCKQVGIRQVQFRAG